MHISVPSHGVANIEILKILYNSSSPKSERRSGKNRAIYTFNNNTCYDVINITRRIFIDLDNIRAVPVELFNTHT